MACKTAVMMISLTVTPASDLSFLTSPMIVFGKVMASSYLDAERLRTCITPDDLVVLSEVEIAWNYGIDITKGNPITDLRNKRI
jgi:hypothetical protein